MTVRVHDQKDLLEKVNALKEKIDLVNKLDEIGLKELYKSTILNDKISEKGGATAQHRHYTRDRGGRQPARGRVGR